MICSLWIPDNEIKVHNPSSPMFNNKRPNNNSSCYSVTMVCGHNINWSCQKHVPVAMVLAFNLHHRAVTKLITIPLAQSVSRHFTSQLRAVLLTSRTPRTCQTFLSSRMTLYRNTAFSVNAQTVPLIGSCVMFTSLPNDYTNNKEFLLSVSCNDNFQVRHPHCTQ
jgi:hypothetical protein